jgi:DUF1680 family protein
LIRFTASLLILIAGPLSAATTVEPVILNAVTDRYRPIPVDQQKLAGLLAIRMRANTEGYLERINDKRLLESGNAGRFLDAAANAVEYNHDQRLKSVMDRVAKELIATQQADGYFGTESEAQRWTAQDVSTYKYDLIGLLAYYHISGDQTALTTCRKAGDLLVSSFRTAGQQNAFSEVSIVEPMVYLYRYTGDTRYLDLSKSIETLWPQQPQAAPNFERLSHALGLIALYRVTGDEPYRRTATSIWIGARDLQLSTPISDNCFTVSWTQLTLELLRITGAAQYANQLELSIYNQLFAAQDARTGNIFSAVPQDGSKKPDVETSACACGEARGISLIPSTAWGRYANGIAVILYTAGRATFQLRRRGTIQIYSEAAYPENGSVLVHVEPAHNIQFPLRLRVPEWTGSFVVDIGESHLVGKPGEFLTLNREWKKGDTVRISIDMTVQILNGGAAHPGEVAIQRGPQLLALGATINPQIKDLAAVGPISADVADLKFAPVENKLPPNWSGDQAYSIAGEYEGNPQQLILVPFADSLASRVWMRTPAASSAAKWF